MAELLPCPFCWELPLVCRTTHRTYVECEKLTVDSHRVMFSGRTDSEAFEAWNTRTPKERCVDK